MLNKLIVSVFAFMLCVLWMNYNDLDRKRIHDDKLNSLRFRATNEALALHAEAINKQTDIMISVIGQINRREK